MNDIKYPKQCYVVKRPTMTLGIDACFALSDETPMCIHSGYSVFKLTIIDKKGVTITPHANIPMRDIPFLSQKTEWCNQKIWDTENEKEKVADTGIPETVFSVKMSGKMKGYTPGSYLLEKGDAGVQPLKDHGNWLYLNGSPKYKIANQKQIKAIKAALAAYEEGRFKNMYSKDICNRCLVYDGGIKYFTTKMEGNNKLCYHVEVNCNLKMQYPYEIKITNWVAPVIVRPNGSTEIQSGQQNLHSSSMLLSVAEWTNLVETLKDRKAQFELSNFTRQYRIMVENSWKPEEQRGERHYG